VSCASGWAPSRVPTDRLVVAVSGGLFAGGVEAVYVGALDTSVDVVDEPRDDSDSDRHGQAEHHERTHVACDVHVVGVTQPVVHRFEHDEDGRQTDGHASSANSQLESGRVHAGLPPGHDGLGDDQPYDHARQQHDEAVERRLAVEGVPGPVGVGTQVCEVLLPLVADHVDEHRVRREERERDAVIPDVVQDDHS